jgi:hypothetical protein
MPTIFFNFNDSKRVSVKFELKKIIGALFCTNSGFTRVFTNTCRYRVDTCLNTRVKPLYGAEPQFPYSNKKLKSFYLKVCFVIFKGYCSVRIKIR